MSGIFKDAITFWKMTIADVLCILHGVSELKSSEIQIDNIRAGNQLAMMVNLTPRKSMKMYKWSDFYNDLSVKEPMSDEEISDKLLAYFGSLKEVKFNGT